MVEVIEQVGLILSLIVDDFKRLGHDEARPLSHAAREVCVGIGVAVDVVERPTVGVVDIDGCLPCPAPVGDILSCERVCGSLKLHDDVLHACLVASLREIEVAIGSTEYVCV